MTLSFQVSQSSDDAYENSGLVNTTGVFSGGVYQASQWIGWRFQNVNIPQGYPIASASLTLNIENTSGSAQHTFYSQEHHDPDPFNSGDQWNLSGRLTSTASVLWEEAPISTGINIVTGLASLIQEVVDQPGWESGNSLVLLCHGNGDPNHEITTRFYDYDPGFGAILEVELETINATGSIRLPSLSLGGSGVYTPTMSGKRRYRTVPFPHYRKVAPLRRRRQR